MRVKKEIKIVGILLLLAALIGIGVYANMKFFQKYEYLKQEESKLEEKDTKEVPNEKEIKIEKEPEVEPTKEEKKQEPTQKETAPITTTTPPTMNEPERISATSEYYCEEGYNLDNNECTKVITEKALEIQSYEFDDGNYYYAVFFDKTFEKEIVQDACVAGKLTFTVSSEGYYGCYINYPVPANSPTQYACLEENETLNGAFCEKKESISVKKRFICPEGYNLIDTTCYK